MQTTQANTKQGTTRRAIAARSNAKSVLFTAAMVGASLAMFGNAGKSFGSAVSVPLTDKNSTINVNFASSTPPAAPVGVNDWTVGGTDVLDSEWFWSGTGTTGQTSLNNMPATVPVTTNCMGDGSNNNYSQVNFVDPNNPLTYQVTFSLVGGQTGSKDSELDETITIMNTGKKSITDRFYAYSDFSLGGAPSGQTAKITGGDTATVTDPTSAFESTTTVSPSANFYETSAAPTLVNALDSSSPLTLNDVTSVKTTSGDATWAFEWDPTIKAGDCYTICIDKQICASGNTVVPEPKAGGLAMIGVGGILLTRRRRRLA